MQKGGGPPWDPIDRWDTLPRNLVNDLPETERAVWLAGIVDEIEDAGRMNDFKVIGNKPNAFREAIVDKVCVQAFGIKYLLKRVCSSTTAQWSHACSQRALRGVRTKLGSYEPTLRASSNNLVTKFLQGHSRRERKRHLRMGSVDCPRRLRLPI